MVGEVEEKGDTAENERQREAGRSLLHRTRVGNRA